MRPYLIIFHLLILLSAFAVVNAQNPNPKYNPTLADSLGADDYGMKSYVFVLLKTGSKVEEDKEKETELFRGHLDNIGRLAEEGKMIVAGPLGKNDQNYRGIFILNVATVEEGEALMQSDPAVATGLLDTDVMIWYGSAALPVYLETHEKIEKMRP